MKASPVGSPSFRYLPNEPEDEIWGIFLRDVGSASIGAGQDYPPAGHPQGYQFSWNEGRVLQEFQVIYVDRGRGVLETRQAGRRTIRAGQAFLLFPGEWHRYRPVPSAGWRESWVGFTGEYATHLMTHFFSAKEPVLSVERGVVNKWMRDLTKGAAGWRSADARCQQRTALLQLIAHLKAQAVAGRGGGPVMGLESARFEILTHAAHKIDWRGMAKRYGMGYATFRRRFKAMTGRAPLDYQIQVRLNRAAEMLRDPSVTAREVADRLGYAHVHFFSRQFKARFGVSPQYFREHPRG
jgi:AraC-like DNA-binding protein